MDPNPPFLIFLTILFGGITIILPALLFLIIATIPLQSERLVKADDADKKSAWNTKKTTKTTIIPSTKTNETSEKLYLTFTNLKFSIKETFYIEQPNPIKKQISTIFPETNEQTKTKIGKLAPVPKKKLKKITEKVDILKGITGYAVPGTLTCIMGPSSCGKTTLLDLLSTRTPASSGNIHVNGKPITNAFMTRVSAYVLQNDVLLENLTILETLLFTTELRIASSVTPEEKLDRVWMVMRALEIAGVANTKVGDLSGGQKRRLSIAIELVTFPSILFLDEPTTGLDAYTSLRLILCLRRLANERSTTILCTINQPRSDIFDLFDNLILLKNGSLAYFGPVCGISEYFLVQNMKIPGDANVADFIVDLTYTKEKRENQEKKTNPLGTNSIVDEYRDEEDDEFEEETHGAQDDDDYLVYAYSISKLKKHMNSICSNFVYDDVVINEKRNYNRSLINQTIILVRRSVANMKRSKAGILGSFGLSCGSLLFFGLLYLGLKTSGKEDTELSFVQSQKAFIFQTLTAVMLMELDILARAFLEKTIFIRENTSGAYSCFSYHILWFLRLNFFGVLRGMFYPLLCYPFVLKLSLFNYLFFSAVLMVISNIGSAIGLLLVSAIPAIEGAASAYSAFIGTMVTFGGFYILPKLIPIWFSFSYYISFYKYALEAVYWNEFYGRSVYIIKTVTNSTATIEKVSEKVSIDVLRAFQVDQSLNKWSNLIALMLFPLIFHLLALVASLMKTRKFKDFFKREGVDTVERQLNEPEITIENPNIIRNRRDTSRSSSCNRNVSRRPSIQSEGGLSTLQSKVAGTSVSNLLMTRNLY